MDKVVDTILELPGDGTGLVKGYNGGYSDYVTARKAVQQDNIEDKPKASKDEEKETREKPKKLKFTYKEQREYESIDNDISNLEIKISDLENQLEKHATDYVKLQELMDEKHRTEEQLEEKMSRWVYLNNLAEQIESQK